MSAKADDSLMELGPLNKFETEQFLLRTQICLQYLLK